METTKHTEDLFGLEGITTQVTSGEVQATFLRAHFNLPWNPFPPSGIATESPDAPPFREEHTRQISEFIRAAYRQRLTTKGLVIIGDFGTGKSHLLRLMEKQINENLADARAIYVDRPRLEAQELNRAILRALGEDTVRKMTWFIVRQQLAEDIQQSSPELAQLRAKVEASKRPPWQTYLPGLDSATVPSFEAVFNHKQIDDYREFFQAYDQQGWNRELLRDYFTNALRRLIVPQSPSEFVNAFVTLLLAPDEKAIASWESLLALGPRQAKTLLRPREFLQDLLKILALNGRNYTFLLIDEFEEVPLGALLTARQREDYLYTVSEVLNQIREGLGLVLSITPKAWERLTELTPQLKDRLPEVIQLGPLDARDVTNMIRYYLMRARENAKKDDPTFTYDEMDLRPFSPEVIQSLVTKFPTDRTARNVLQFLYQLVEYCATNQIASITLEVLDEALKIFDTMKVIRRARGVGR
jgi:hypothetical protein